VVFAESSTQWLRRHRAKATRLRATHASPAAAFLGGPKSTALAADTAHLARLPRDDPYPAA